MHLVTVEYQNSAVSFTEDGWFNATEVAARYGKRVNDWIALPGTQEYLQALSDVSDDGADPITRKSGIWIVTKRGQHGGTWMHPDLAVAFARWLDVRFAVWCDRQIRAILSGTHPHYNWKKLRHEATASYKVMSQILQLTRERLGKATAPHHFSNEARLINHALTGVFGKVDRNGLSSGDLDLLAKLENLNTVLLGVGAVYEDRKRELERYAQDQRLLNAPCLSAAG